MRFTHVLPSPSPKFHVPNAGALTRTHRISLSCNSSSSVAHIYPNNQSKTQLNFPIISNKNNPPERIEDETEINNALPTMSEIMEVSKGQKLDLQLQTIGPFFRITAKSLETPQMELGRAEGLIRVWFGGKILHLDSIRLKRETMGMERSIFGTGLFIGAVAIRYGYDSGCTTAQLLAINDSDLYHSKLVRFYKRIGFKTVKEVNGSSMGDLPHMLVWGGVGTRMDASVKDLLVKWCTRFKQRKGRG